MPSIGSRCHELRVRDEAASWRLIYRVDVDAIVLLDVFSKKTGKTPAAVIRACKSRLKRYDELTRSQETTHEEREPSTP
jgi:phage-related protein